MTIRYNVIANTSRLNATIRSGKSIDTQQGLLDAGAILLSRTRQRFLQERDPEGRKWIPSRAAIEEGRKTLFDTGSLFRSLQLGRTGKKVTVGVNPTFKNRVTGENVLRYATKFQTGVGEEQRIIVGVGTRDLPILTRAIESDIVKQLS